MHMPYKIRISPAQDTKNMYHNVRNFNNEDLVDGDENEKYFFFN
jgi:hypothetical protein